MVEQRGRLVVLLVPVLTWIETE